MADFDVRKTFLLHNSCGGCVVALVWVAGFVMAGLWLLRLALISRWIG